MLNLTTLKPMQLDALREVANIGAGHAATALSQLTSQRIMITVPQISISSLEDVAPHIGAPDEPLAVVIMDMLGDLTGRTLLVFPSETALRLADMLIRRPPGESVSLGKMEQSAIMEAGNILSGAYLNALSDFMGIMLLPSPPRLTIDEARVVLISSYAPDEETGFAFCVETEFYMRDAQERIRGFFLLLPDVPSLRAILRAVRLA
jgi:chemotaxis protein CheC